MRHFLKRNEVIFSFYLLFQNACLLKCLDYLQSPLLSGKGVIDTLSELVTGSLPQSTAHSRSNPTFVLSFMLKSNSCKLLSVALVIN